MAQATAMPANAPVESPSEDSEGDVDDVASLVGVTVSVTTPASLWSRVCDGAAVVWAELADWDDEGSLPTAGGPCVEPLRSWAACRYISGVFPVRPVMLKRGE